MSGDVVIMAAPNGARKTKIDHAAVPLSIEETVTEAKACFNAGASILHAHVRGSKDEHVLDSGLYQELLSEMQTRVPQMLVQITSEAVGRYTPDEQIDCIQSVTPHMASMSLREITSDFKNTDLAGKFFNWSDEAQVQIQHIVFSHEELDQFHSYRKQGIIPATHNCVLLVLGRYSANFQSDPSDLAPFVTKDLDQLDWFTCAFGHQEQNCVMKGIENGGHARVGFENNLYLPDGELAASTAELVTSLANRLEQDGRRVANPQAAAQLLGIRNP